MGIWSRFKKWKNMGLHILHMLFYFVTLVLGIIFYKLPLLISSNDSNVVSDAFLLPTNLCNLQILNFLVLLSIITIARACHPCF